MGDDTNPATKRSGGPGNGDDAVARLERWLTDHRAAMLSVAQRYEGRAIRADDIVQDASVQAMSLTDRVRAVEHPRRWLRTITKYVGMRAVTKRRRRAELLKNGLEDPTVELEREDRGPEAWGSEERLSTQLEIVMDAVRLLRPAQREVLWLGLDGKQDDEISRILKIGKATVRVRRHRAIKMLKTELLEETPVSARLPNDDA